MELQYKNFGSGSCGRTVADEAKILLEVHFYW